MAISTPTPNERDTAETIGRIDERLQAILLRVIETLQHVQSYKLSFGMISAALLLNAIALIILIGKL